MSTSRRLRLLGFTLVFLTGIQVPCQVPEPPAGTSLSSKVDPLSEASFQALRQRGEDLLQAMASEVQSREDWALAKALRFELEAFGGHVKALPRNWNWKDIEAAIKDPSNPEKRAVALVALQIAQATPQWTTRSDSRGKVVFFQASRALVDSEFGFGVRIPEEDLEKRALLTNLKRFCEDMESFRSAFSKAFQGIAQEEANKASARSDAFIQKVFNRQFPWEAWLNSHWAPGTLMMPPRHQFILGHLHAGLQLTTRGQSTATPTVLLEVFGWEALGSTYDPSWGLSAAYAPRLRPGEKDGGGLLIHLKSQSFGVVWKAEVGQGRTPHVVYSLALGRWLSGSK